MRIIFDKNGPHDQGEQSPDQLHNTIASAIGEPALPCSWAAEVIADDSGKWTANALRFATDIEAKAYVANLYARWTAVRETRVVQSPDPVNTKWDTEKGTTPVRPRSTGELEVTPITTPEEVEQAIRDLTGGNDGREG
jgi:hypothetical protein